MAKLTAMKKRFCEEYVIDLNACESAIRAGYSKKTAYSQGPRLLQEKVVQTYIQKLIKKRSERTEITADRVLQELAKVGFANMLDYMTVQSDGCAYIDLSDLTKEQAAALMEVTVEEYTEGQGKDARNVKRVKIKLTDKIRALRSIGDHLGMFKNIHEHTGKNGVPLAVNCYLPDNGRNDRNKD